MVSLLSLVAIAVFVSALVVRVVRVCACARWVTLMVYFPAMALPAVVALNAVVLLVVLVAEKKIGFRQCSIGGLESRQRAFQRTVGAKFSGKRRLLI